MQCRCACETDNYGRASNCLLKGAVRWASRKRLLLAVQRDSLEPSNGGKMSSSQSPQVKTCVTCQYWGGTRKASSPFRDGVEYGSNQDKGECVGGGQNR